MYLYSEIISLRDTTLITEASLPLCPPPLRCSILLYIISLTTLSRYLPNFYQHEYRLLLCIYMLRHLWELRRSGRPE